MAYDRSVDTDDRGSYVGVSEYQGDVMITFALYGGNVTQWISPEKAREVAQAIVDVADMVEDSNNGD